jgi:signal transduction histidine kinase
MVSTHDEIGAARGNRQKLLLIDDDPSVIASLRLLFEADYDISLASTVGEGLCLFTSVRPTIVILDLKLPDRSGIDALREIRKIDPTAAVVILTGYSTRLAAEESLRLGARDYVNKPFDAGDLKNRIAKLAPFSQIRIKDEHIFTLTEESVRSFGEIRELQNASAAFLHDVAGPLSCLMAGSDLLSDKVNEKDEITADEIVSVVAMMADSVRYLRALVEQWRAFSDLHVLMKDKCDVQKAIDLAVSQVVDILSPSSVVFQIQSRRESHNVPGNHFALARVLINLLKNAYEAVSPDCGRICLTVTTADNSVQLVVSDNGPGIAPNLMHKVFTPQFSTKANGRGLGLFISNKIIEAVEGKITVRSPGTLLGTDFIITLPRV